MPGPVSDSMPSLGDRMRALASRGHPRADELVEKADAMEKAASEFTDAKKVLGTWARARRLWCDCTGEPLM